MPEKPVAKKSTTTPVRKARARKTAVVHDFLTGGGEMGEATRAFDWSKTAVGTPDSWPVSLRTAVSIVLNSSFPMFIWWGKDELINIYNDAYKVILGEKHTGALGQSAPKVWADIWDNVGPLAEQVFTKGQPVFMKDLRLLMNRFGYEEETYFTFSYSPIRSELGEIGGMLCAVTETTEEIIGKRNLEENRAQLEAVFQSVTDGIGVFDMQGNLILLNDALARINGYPDTETMKQDIASFAKTYRLMNPEGKVLAVKDWPVARVLRGETFSDMELRGKRLDTGKEWSFSFSGAPALDHIGKQTLAITVTRDITAQKKAEEELRESEQRFRNIADTAPMYLAMADESGNAVYFNKPWLEFTGKKLDDMLGLGWLSTLHPDDAAKFEEDFKHAFSRHIPINEQYRFRRTDGEYRWMLAVGAPRFTTEGRFIGYYGTYTDFHDLKMAQIAVEKSEERFRTMANNISQLVWTIDRNGSALWFNQRWFDYTGATFKGVDEKGWGLVQHPKHKKRVLEKFRNKLRSGETWEDTFPLRGKDGKYRWFLSRAIPVRDTQGNITHWFGTNTDIDDLRRATRRKLQLERTTTLLEEQRTQLLELNQAKDEFISLASHQLRTPATGVKQYIGMLLEGYAGPLDSSQRHFLQTAYESNERQLKIVDDLLKVARVDSGKMQLKREKIHIALLLQEIIDEQASKFVKSNQQLSFIHPHRAVYVSADETLLRMAFENLIDNAHKYTYEGKSIEVRVIPGNSSVQIAIKDEGTGIEPADIGKLFHKFSRIDNPLSATVGGSGLGLYWVKRVIDLHNGTIDVVSNPGQGTTFTISLK